MPQSDRLLVAASKAIDCVFFDVAASQEKTLDRLRELRDEIDNKIDAIKVDLRVRDCATE